MMEERVLVALERRKNAKDRFREENGYSWDYVFVFKVYEDDEEISEMQQEFNMKLILGQLGAGGLEFRLLYSIQVLM